jgi:hypothetical protein
MMRDITCRPAYDRWGSSKIRARNKRIDWRLAHIKSPKGPRTPNVHISIWCHLRLCRSKYSTSDSTWTAADWLIDWLKHFLRPHTNYPIGGLVLTTAEPLFRNLLIPSVNVYIFTSSYYLPPAPTLVIKAFISQLNTLNPHSKSLSTFIGWPRCVPLPFLLPLIRLLLQL